MAGIIITTSSANDASTLANAIKSASSANTVLTVTGNQIEVGMTGYPGAILSTDVTPLANGLDLTLSFGTAGTDSVTIPGFINSNTGSNTSIKFGDGVSWSAMSRWSSNGLRELDIYGTDATDTLRGAQARSSTPNR